MSTDDQDSGLFLSSLEAAPSKQFVLEVMEGLQAQSSTCLQSIHWPKEWIAAACAFSFCFFTLLSLPKDIVEDDFHTQELLVLQLEDNEEWLFNDAPDFEQLMDY